MNILTAITILIAQIYPYGQQPEVIHINPSDGKRAELAQKAMALESMGIKSQDRAVFVNPSPALAQKLQAEQIYRHSIDPYEEQRYKLLYPPIQPQEYQRR